MTPEEERTRGHQAQQVLGNPIYIEAFDEIKERLWSQISNADTAADRKQRCVDLATSLESVRKYMKNVMDGGKMAVEQIERDRTFTERMRDKVRSVA